MFPIGDDNSANNSRPYINWLLIAINIIVFVFFQKFGENESFLASFSVVPEEILTSRDVASNGLGVTPIPVYATIFTSMFMHANFMHIAGNMLYLWIFGDNLENRMGHIKYLLFYLLCGVIASLSHVYLSSALDKDLMIPSLGASGAISGVLGGYLLLFPKNRVRMFALRTVISVPAYLSLGIWILLQIIEGYSSMRSAPGEGQGGVAYAAHVGGFLAGLLLVKLFARKPLQAAA